MNKLRIILLNKYLPPIFHPGFNRNDGVVIYVHEFIEYEVVCTKANQCLNIGKAMNKNNQCFVVVCMYIFPSFKHSLRLNEVELLPNDISKLMGSPVFIVGDMIIDLVKQNNLHSNYSKLLQYNGMTQLLKTATRTDIDSATLIDHVNQNHFFDKPDCGIIDAG